MSYKDGLIKNKSGSYVLKHKTKESKEGDCSACGENPKTRALAGLYRYKTEDMLLVRAHMENHLRFFSKHESIKPVWCKKCQVLLEYTIIISTKKTNI